MKSDTENEINGGEKHNLDNLIITLHDNRSRILWSSHVEGDQLGVGDSLVNQWPAQEAEKLKWAISTCFMESESISLVLRLAESSLWRITMISIGSPEMSDESRAALQSLAPGVSVIALRSQLPENYEAISDGDKELLRLLCEDCTLRQAANKMLLSESAIDAKIRKLKQKLDVHNIGGLVAKAIRQTII